MPPKPDLDTKNRNGMKTGEVQPEKDGEKEKTMENNTKVGIQRHWVVFLENRYKNERFCSDFFNIPYLHKQKKSINSYSIR